jgi:hypothetical protein
VALKKGRIRQIDVGFAAEMGDRFTIDPSTTIVFSNFGPSRLKIGTSKKGRLLVNAWHYGEA